MELKNQNILFFTRTMKTGGTEQVVLQLCKVLQPEVNNIVVCSCGGVNTEVLKKMGIRHYQIPDIEEKSFGVLKTVFRQLNSIVKNENISIIHTHHRMAAFYTKIMLLCNKRKLIFINTSHNTFFDKKILTRFSYKTANLIACGEKVKENLVNFYSLPEKRVTVIHNAVEAYDEEKVDVPELLELRNNGYILVGNIGRLSKQKGMEYFLKSLPQVREKYRNVKYVLIGDGEDKEKLIELAQELDITNEVIFLGYRCDVRNVMSQLDIIVLSSLWEGLPLTPIEAFSIGKTIVATSVDGTIEIVENGKNGLLVEKENEKELAEGIIKLIKEPDLRELFEKNALKTYEDEFSFDKYAQKIIAYYSALEKEV